MQVWAAYFVGAYERHIGLSENDYVLDFGAGYGSVSAFIRNKVKHIYLLDKADYMQEVLKFNYSQYDNMEVIGDLDEINEKVSVIIVNSVAQYIDKEEFKSILKGFKKVCKPDAQIVIADLIPNNYSKLQDFRGQLSLSLKYGFFTKLLVYAVSNTFFSPKLSLSGDYLIKYDPEEMIAMLSDHGFESRLAESNFTYSRKRFTILAKPSG